ncbi:MAG: hypothetical protein J6C77_03695 [Muribaculaceae bacterium]|nr:hypothetical protein [Muribaculaceae bacterium]
MHIVKFFCVLLCVAAVSCQSTSGRIADAVEEASGQCPVELSYGVMLRNISLSPNGDVCFEIDAPGSYSDSALMAQTLAAPEFQSYWLEQILPSNANAEFIEAVKSQGAAFVFEFTTSDGKKVTQRIQPK